MFRKQMQLWWNICQVTFAMILMLLTFTSKAQEPLYVSTIQWSPDGAMIAMGVASDPELGCRYNSYNVQLFDVVASQYTATLEPRACAIASVNFNSGGNSLVVSAANGNTTVWNVENFDRQFATLIFNIILKAELNYDSTLLLTVYSNGVEISDLPNRQIFGTSRSAVPSLRNITDATWSPDDSMIAIGDENGQVHLWNIAANTIDAIFDRHSGAINTIAWNPTQNVIASADASGNLRIWDATTLQLLVTSWNQMQPINELVWRADGKELAGVSEDGTTTIFSMSNGTWSAMESIPGIATALAYSPSGGRIAVGQQIASDQAQSLSTGALPFKILVPIATLDRFAEIAAFCNAPASLTTAAEDTSLQAQSELVQGQTLLAQLDALPEDAIPPGCEADLRAIAEAIQAER